MRTSRGWEWSQSFDWELQIIGRHNTGFHAWLMKWEWDEIDVCCRMFSLMDKWWRSGNEESSKGPLYVFEDQILGVQVVHYSSRRFSSIRKVKSLIARVAVIDSHSRNPEATTGNDNIRTICFTRPVPLTHTYVFLHHMDRQKWSQTLASNSQSWVIPTTDAWYNWSNYEPRQLIKIVTVEKV